MEEEFAHFHGRLSRQEAEQILVGQADGTYLTRVSTTNSGDYVLSLSFQKSLYHFQIKSLGECWFSIDDGPKFEGMEPLLKYYMAHSDGLPCMLTKPIPLAIRKKNDAEGNSNLHNACFKGTTSTIKSHLKPAEVTKVNKLRRIPLHEAVRGNQPAAALDVLNFMRTCGADTSAADEFGCTPLHLSALYGFDAVTKLLIIGGVKPHLRNTFGETARDIAARRANVESCRLAGHAENGLVTEEALDLVDMPWFHGKISRPVAEHLLALHGGSSGLFLLRESTTVAGDFALSMTSSGGYFHFQIQCLPDMKNCYFIDDGPVFDGLRKIVEYYRTAADGLPCPLRFYCRRCSPSNRTFQPTSFETAIVPVRPLQPGTQGQTRTRTGTARPRNMSGTVSSTAELGDIDYNHMEPSEGRAEGPSIIQADHLTLGKELGSGEFGAVIKGTWRRPGGGVVDVAIKTLRADAVGRSDEFLREAQLMARLKHPNVVNLLGVSMSQPVMIVQELVPLGALVDFLPKHKSLTNDDLRRFAVQISLGMSFLEEQRFVHRDLAARNILVATPQLVKISDFGLSRSMSQEENYYKASAGGKWPIKWYAPESVYYGKFTSKSDVWGFGVTLWEIWTFGDMPYGDLTGREVLEQLDKGQRMQCPPRCPLSVHEVMKQCWEYDPDHRPAFITLHDRLRALRF